MKKYKKFFKKWVRDITDPNLGLPESKINFLTTISSFFYLYFGYLLLQKNPLISISMFVIGIISFLHHYYPKKPTIKILDYTAAYTLIFFVLFFVKDINVINFIYFIIVITLIRICSRFAYRRKKVSTYQIIHAVWHFATAFMLYAVFY